MTAPELTPAERAVVDLCRWYCATCRRCHGNACPALWGGTPEVPCGHSAKRGAR